MKIALLNDTHCGARNSAEWMIKYQELFYREVFFPYLLKHDIKKIIHLGDYYESRKTAATIQAIQANQEHFINPMRERGITMDLLLGNHDVFHKNTNRINSPQILLKDSGVVNIITKPSTIEYDGLSVCMVPWITQDNFEACTREIEATKANICFGHFEFAGFPFHKGGSPCLESNYVSPEMVSRFKMVLSGHFHTKSKRANIAYLGSQMEFTWADCEDQKHFHIFDTDNPYELTLVKNPFPLFVRLELPFTMYDAVVISTKDKFVEITKKATDDEDKFNEFVKAVSEVAIDVKVISPADQSDEIDVDMSAITGTPELMKAYVNEMTTTLNKDRLVNMMEDLYRSAISQ